MDHPEISAHPAAASWYGKIKRSQDGALAEINARRDALWPRAGKPNRVHAGPTVGLWPPFCIRRTCRSR